MGHIVDHFSRCVSREWIELLRMHMCARRRRKAESSFTTGLHQQRFLSVRSSRLQLQDGATPAGALTRIHLHTRMQVYGAAAVRKLHAWPACSGFIACQSKSSIKLFRKFFSVSSFSVPVGGTFTNNKKAQNVETSQAETCWCPSIDLLWDLSCPRSHYLKAKDPLNNLKGRAVVLHF